MKILSIANQKGGVGKSTTTVHLAYAALEAGLRVLLVDLDVQGHTGMMFEAPQGTETGLVGSQLFDETPNALLPQKVTASLSVIRADMALIDIDDSKDEVRKRPAIALRRFAKDFDLCLIDCPPALSVRLFSALSASDYVITPLGVGKYAISGVADLMHTIHVVRTQGFNPRLRHVGWLPSKINGRSKLDRAALDGLRENYGASILPFVLTERAAVKEATENGLPVWAKVRGVSHKKAATEWQEACQYVLSAVLKHDVKI